MNSEQYNLLNMLLAQADNHSYIEIAIYTDITYRDFALMSAVSLLAFTKYIPTIYALDEVVYKFFQSLGFQVKALSPHDNPHVTKISVIKSSSQEIVLCVDADCWLKSPQIFNTMTQAIFNSSKHKSFWGDIGLIDLPYLFFNNDSTLACFRKLSNIYPRFTDIWLKSPEIEKEKLRPNTGCVVDLPLMYGAFAAYRCNDFREIDVPSWVHSADIWLSAFIYERSLDYCNIGTYHFNESPNSLVHWIKSKPQGAELSHQLQHHWDLIKKFCLNVKASHDER